MGGTIGLLAAVALHAGTVEFAANVDLSDRAVRLGEIADLGALPRAMRDTAAALVVATLPRGVTQARFDLSEIRSRARSLMPALAAFLAPDGQGEVTVAVRRSRSGRAQQGACARLASNIPAGESPTTGQLQAEPCSSGWLPAAFRADPWIGAVVASHDLHAGDVVRAPPGSDVAQARRGAPVTISIGIGRIRTERRVVAIQPQLSGRGLFVRGEDGATFSAPAQEVVR